MKTLVRKLQVEISNPNLPILPDKVKEVPIEVRQGSGSVSSEKLVYKEDLNNVLSVQFRVDAPEGCIRKYSMIGNSGKVFIKGDDAKGYYIYEPNKTYSFNGSEINPDPDATFFEPYINDANTLENGSVIATIEIFLSK